MSFEEGALFELACMAPGALTWEGASTLLQNHIAQLSGAEATELTTSLAIHALHSYATLGGPTPRQHILRITRTFAPELLETLPLKLDGASPSHVMEVLAALEKKYALFVGLDVQYTADVVSHILAQNRQLHTENEELRAQVLHGEEFQRRFREFMGTHEALVTQLYETHAALQRVSEERAMLRAQVSLLTEVGAREKSVTGPESQPSSPQRNHDGGAAPAKLAALTALESVRAELDACKRQLHEATMRHAAELGDRESKWSARELEYVSLLQDARHTVERLTTKRSAAAKHVDVISVETQCDAPPETSRRRGQSLRSGTGTPTPPATPERDNPSSGAEEKSPLGVAPESVAEDLIPVAEVRPILAELRRQNGELRDRLVVAQRAVEEYERIVGLRSRTSSSSADPGVARSLSPSAFVRQQRISALEQNTTSNLINTSTTSSAPGFVFLADAASPARGELPRFSSRVKRIAPSETILPSGSPGGPLLLNAGNTPRSARSNDSGSLRRR